MKDFDVLSERVMVIPRGQEGVLAAERTTLCSLYKGTSARKTPNRYARLVVAPQRKRFNYA